MEENFLSLVMGSPDTGDLLLDLMVTRPSELIGDIKGGGSQDCSEHHWWSVCMSGQVKSYR